jgi:hypothetical protein
MIPVYHLLILLILGMLILVLPATSFRDRTRNARIAKRPKPCSFNRSSAHPTLGWYVSTRESVSSLPRLETLLRLLQLRQDLHVKPYSCIFERWECLGESHWFAIHVLSIGWTLFSVEFMGITQEGSRWEMVVKLAVFGVRYHGQPPVHWLDYNVR